eukprot:1601835-Pleurochrysis_carterae.AAC.4
MTQRLRPSACACACAPSSAIALVCHRRYRSNPLLSAKTVAASQLASALATRFVPAASAISVSFFPYPQRSPTGSLAERTHSACACSLVHHSRSEPLRTRARRRALSSRRSPPPPT